jgi:hypothetical protein
MDLAKAALRRHDNVHLNEKFLPPVVRMDSVDL